MDDLLTFGIMVVFSFFLLTHADKKWQTRNQRRRKTKLNQLNKVHHA